MAALTQDRNTPQAIGDMREGAMAATTTIYGGAIVMRNASGYLRQGATATALVGVGRAEARAVNGGDAGAANVKYRAGVFRFGNSASGDAITVADIGAVCFAVDDQTVAKTNGTNTRSPAGFVDHVDSLGVWVRFDEAAIRAWAKLTADIAAID